MIEGDVEEEVMIVADNESGNISLPIVFNINEAETQPPAAVSPAIPSLQGQAPSCQSNQRANIDSRPIRERRRTVRAPRQARARVTAQTSKTHLQQARGVIHRLEELRAEAALKNAETQLLIAQNQRNSAQALNTVADSFKLIAQSIDKLSQKYYQQQQAGP